jgi:predicted amidohydrolase
MKICLAQLEVAATKKANLDKILAVLEGLEEGTRLVVFPEYSMGYPKGGLTLDYVREASEDLGEEFVSEVAASSAKRGTSVLLPVFERGRGRVYNTAVVISDGKVRGRYRKVRLFDALGYKESEVFGTGSELVVFKLGGLCFGTVICYDVRFPELVKKQAMAGAEVILVPAAWYRGQMKEEQWQTLLMARAHEDTCYVVGVGNANSAFIGRSIAVTPFGVKALDLGVGERTGYFDLDRRLVSDARKGLPVLKQSDGKALQVRRLN